MIHKRKGVSGRRMVFLNIQYIFILFWIYSALKEEIFQFSVSFSATPALIKT